jgi:hypothetical protein
LWPFCQISEAQTTFFRNNTLLSTDLHQKNISLNAARWRFSLISVEKIVHLTPTWFLDAILIFTPIIYFFFQKYEFFNKNHFTEWKYICSLIFAKKIENKVKNPPSWIVPPFRKIFKNGLLQNFSTIEYYKTWMNFLKNLTF